MAMERGERASDKRIAQPGEPVRAVGRQRLQVPADDVDEHQFAQATEHTLSADVVLTELYGLVRGHLTSGRRATNRARWPVAQTVSRVGDTVTMEVITVIN
jgi:hypothetical protein